MTKKLIKYVFNQDSITVTTGLTEQQAKDICDRPETQGKDWFYGYEEER